MGPLLVVTYTMEGWILFNPNSRFKIQIKIYFFIYKPLCGKDKVMFYDTP